MIVEQFTQVCGKNRFATTIQIEAKDLIPLQRQAYKDAVSVQHLIRNQVETALADLIIFSKGA